MSDIELILTKLKIVSEEKEQGAYICDKEHSKILLDYIQQRDNIIKEVRKMLQNKIDFHKNLDFYEDKELETQVYLNYVACLQDFDEIAERYSKEEK